ncbi:hypothetical protein [Thermoflexus sp.]|nr:hypothetical protein [Thermoflexus sp.]
MGLLFKLEELLGMFSFPTPEHRWSKRLGIWLEQVTHEGLRF